ncbi:MAG: response regulator [Burkholderiaceae bacterium]
MAERETAEAAGRVLVVDDDRLVTMIACDVLSRAGYEVDHAYDGETAVTMFRDATPPFDAVLLDLVMPGMDGAETARRMRAIRPDFRLLIVSGHSAEFIAPRIADLSVDAVIMKPWMIDALLEAVRRVLPVPCSGGGAD